MKAKYLFISVVASMLLTACMDGKDYEWNTPHSAVIGNEDLAETNLVSIATLKNQYSSILFGTNYDMQQITENVQIKGRVTGNDIGGNVYNEVAIDDGTGVILVCISEGGLFSYLPVGQEILIELNGLYIGNYGLQPEIGTPYMNKNGRTYVSRMNRKLWGQHFKLLGTPDVSKVHPVEFDLAKINDKIYLQDNCGRLMTIKGVKFSDADGVVNFANDDEKDAGNCVNRSLQGINSGNMVVRTSSFARFAGLPLPQEKVNLTGIFTRYSSTWQILLRDDKDIELAD